MNKQSFLSRQLKNLSLVIITLATTPLIKCNENTTLAGDVTITGTIKTQGNALINGDQLVLQKQTGNSPIIEFRDGADEGGMVKGKILTNPFPGEKGISFNLDLEDNQYSLSLQNDGSVYVNKKLWVAGDEQVSGDLLVQGNLRNYATNKGHIYFSTTTTCTFGQPIQFNREIDPGNNILDMAGNAVGVYLPSESGYYLVTVRINGDNISIPTTITGTPIALLELKQGSNSIPLSNYVPLLPYSGKIQHTLSGIIRLNAGEGIQANLSLFAMTDTGYTQLDGTVDLKGDVQGRSSYMTVHYLSSNL